MFDAGYDTARLAWLLRDLPVQLLGRLRSDQVLCQPDVHRNGDSGSPRVAGSTRASSAPTRPGSTPASDSRRAPARQAPAPPHPPSSLIAAVTVVRDAPPSGPPPISASAPVPELLPKPQPRVLTP